MKGFLRWFKSGAKMKRWVVIILIGVTLCCYGMMKILTGKELEFMELARIITVFVIGFVLLIVGIISIQKRTLELLVAESDKRNSKKDTDVKSLIFNKKVYNQGPKIVAIGGGTGLNSVLKGLKHYTDNITAIVTVSDYGEQVSDSRKMLETMPLDDIKQSLIALSANEDAMAGILNYKFNTGKLKALSFGDIYLLGMKELYGDFAESIKQSKEVLNITGKVLPVTLEEIKICAELEDGTIIENREKIEEEVTSRISKINRIFINPTSCKPAPGVLEAIAEADAIVIGPGSLYTNVIPNLLVKGVTKAIKESKAFKIYVSNLMTEPGQTDTYSLSDHIKAIKEHVGEGVIEYCIYDNGDIIPEFIRKYNMEGQDLVEIDVSKAKAEGVNLMQRDISCVTDGYVRHNPDAIAASIIQLICDDLKFNDMQNNTQYMILNDKLKDAKKSLKQDQKARPKTNNKTPRGKSKFYQKYQERIKSIQEAEIKEKEREKKRNMPKRGRKKKEETKIEIKPLR